MQLVLQPKLYSAKAQRGKDIIRLYFNGLYNFHSYGSFLFGYITENIKNSILCLYRGVKGMIYDD